MNLAISGKLEKLGTLAFRLLLRPEVTIGALTPANVNAGHYRPLSGILFQDNQGLTDSFGPPAKRAVVPWLTSAKLNLKAPTPVPVSSDSFTSTIPANSVAAFSSRR